MKTTLKVALLIFAGIAICWGTLFSYGFAKGMWRQFKIHQEIRRGRTVFNVTLTDSINTIKDMTLGLDSYYRKDLLKYFDYQWLGSEFSMETALIKLNRDFLGAECATVLYSRHDNHIYGIAVVIRRQGSSDPTAPHESEAIADRIRQTIENKHTCATTQIVDEPLFVKKFIKTKGYYAKRLANDLLTDQSLNISKKSCCIRTPHYVASIFPISYRDPESIDPFPVEYVFLLINTPDFYERMMTEKMLNQQDQARKEADEKSREDKSAYDAL